MDELKKDDYGEYNDDDDDDEITEYDTQYKGFPDYKAAKDAYAVDEYSELFDFCLGKLDEYQMKGSCLSDWVILTSFINIFVVGMPIVFAFAFSSQLWIRISTIILVTMIIVAEIVYTILNYHSVALRNFGVYKRAMKRIISKGLEKELLSDFASSELYCGNNIRVGNLYLYGRQSGEIVRLDKITKLCRRCTVYKNDEDDVMSEIFVKSGLFRYNITRIHEFNKSNELWNEISNILKGKVRNIKFESKVNETSKQYGNKEVPY